MTVPLPELLSSHRVETYWIEVLDGDDNPLYVLDGTSRGTVSYNYDSRIRSGFQFTLTTEEVDFDWLTVRFRPWIMVNGQKWPLGVFVTSNPTLGRVRPGISTYAVAAHDKTILLDQDKSYMTISLEQGHNAVEWAKIFIEIMVGESAIVYNPSDVTLPATMVWRAGTPYLDIVNDLLDLAGYERVWVDRYGRFILRPQIDIQNRSPVWTFAAGETAIHSPEWGRSQNIAEVPNRVILRTSGTDEVPEMLAVANNMDPDSPWSRPSRGYWVTRVYDVEAPDQVTLDSMAQRYLSNATRAVAHLEVRHAWVPYEGGDVVTFRSGPVDVNAQVNEYSITMKAGALVSAKWVEI